MTRNLANELDQLKERLDMLQKRVESMGGLTGELDSIKDIQKDINSKGHVILSGEWSEDGRMVRLESKKLSMASMLQSSSEDSSKILTALGHKQRMDILKCLLVQPCTGNELIELLRMGTTGQFYHHLKALIGANLIEQKERGGLYAIPPQRIIPLMVILTGTSDLLDVATFVEMTEIREKPEPYIGVSGIKGYDANQLLLAILEYPLQEVMEGYGDTITISFQEDGSITVSDNGRGIPVRILTEGTISHVQSVLTNLRDTYTQFIAAGGKKESGIGVVNALSSEMFVAIQRSGKLYNQTYKNGVPTSSLTEAVSIGKESGTSITFTPNKDLFTDGFNMPSIREHLENLRLKYPKLKIVLKENVR